MVRPTRRSVVLSLFPHIAGSCSTSMLQPEHLFKSVLRIMHIIFVCASARLETLTLLLSFSQRILKYFVYFAKYAKCFSSPHRLPTNHAYGTCQGGTSVRSSKQSTLLETNERSLSKDQKGSSEINSVCLIVLLKECEPVKSQHHSCC